MSFELLSETEEHYFVSIAPELSAEELQQLPDPYWGRYHRYMRGYCGDVVAVGWPHSAVVEADEFPENTTMLAIDKHCLGLASLSPLDKVQRAQAFSRIEIIQAFALRTFFDEAEQQLNAAARATA